MSGHTPNPDGPEYGPHGQYGLTPHGPGGQGQPPHGQPGGQYGAPPGGYSGQGPQGPQGPPPGYGQPPHAQSPQTQMGWQPTAPPPKKKSPLGLILGLVGGFLALLLIVGVAVWVLVLNNRPQDTVEKYFEAIQAGNAAEALSYAAVPPVDKTLLTDDVLKKANELGGVSNVDIASASGSKVRVRYSVGGESQFTFFDLSKTDDGWKMNEVAFKLNLRSSTKNVPLVVNGVKANTENAMVFPGTYEISTGSKWYAWTESQVTVGGSEVNLPGRVELTSEGEDAARAAIKKWFDGCLAKKELKPKGCPFQLRTVNGTPDKSTIKWSVNGKSPSAVWRPRPPEDVSKVTGHVIYRIHLQFTYTRSGTEHNYDQQALFTQSMIVNMTKDPLTVTWQTR